MTDPSKADTAASPQAQHEAPSPPDRNGGVPAVVAKSEKLPAGRDEGGRFVPGHSGGPGRPLGSKNKLTEDFIADFHKAWLESGSKALRHMVENDASGFVRAAVQLMPKDVLLQARGAGLIIVKLSDEDLAL